MLVAINRFFGIFAALVAIAGVIAGCNAAQRPAPVAPVEGAHTVFVIGTGWHTGLALARADIAASGRVPERDAFPDAQYLEFGWGDREYYPATRATIGMALGAAFASSASVVHLAGYRERPDRRYPSAEVVALSLDESALARLIAAIDRTFDRKGASHAEVVAPGLYRDSLFYPGQGRFSLFNTCNTWVARMLAEARLDISPAGVATASDLMSRVRTLSGAAKPGAP